MTSKSENVPFAEALSRASVPDELKALFRPDEVAERERAWEGFVRRYSRLMVKVTRLLGRDYDDAMDHYAYVLEELRRDDFCRLRSYVTGSTAKFEIWLVAVVRRLCVDHHRRKYGRPRGRQGPVAAPDGVAVARKHLADFVMQDIAEAKLAAAGSNSEMALRRRELEQLVTEALASLDERDQLLLRLRYQDDVPVREMAEIMRFPSVFHAYRRLKALLKDLEATLRRRGVEEAEP